MYAVKCVASYDFLAQLESIVVHDCYVVRIPSYRTAYVEHYLWSVEEQRRNLVGNDFCWMEMTSVESDNLLSACSVADVEVV